MKILKLIFSKNGERFVDFDIEYCKMWIVKIFKNKFGD